MMVDRVLTKLQMEDANIEIVKIDVVTHPLTTWKNGIRMFPALKAGARTLSGIFLSEEDIRRFIDETNQHPTKA